MVTVYTEKFDVGIKIAAALQGFDVGGIHVTLDNIEKVIDKVKSAIKKNGYIKIRYKGEEYAITWGQGHMYGLYQAKDYDPEYAKWSAMPLPFFPEEYKLKVRDGIDYATKKPTGKPDPWTVAQLKIVKNLFKESDYAISATDDDREGHLIFAYVYEMLGVNVPYKRLTINSMTKEGFVTAFDNLKDSSEVHSIEQAGRGRNVADWVVGANLSAAMTLKFSKGPTLTVGRVQTPTLAMLVKRELEIKNFKSHPFWTVEGNFSDQNGQQFVGKHEKTQIENKGEAEKILDRASKASYCTVEKYEEKKVSKDVPLLYNLTTLSMDANEKYGMTAQQVLNIAQELYMAGYLTYPRTSSQYLTDDMVNDVDEVLDMLKTIPEYKAMISPVKKREHTKRHFDSSKVQAHFAIIPTNSKPSSLSDPQKKIYDLCARSLIRTIYKPAKVLNVSLVIDANGEKFKSSGSTIEDAQWMIAGDNSKETVIPKLNIGDHVTGEFSLKEGKTEPPKRYTDKTLLSALRTAGKQVEDDELREIMMQETEGGIGTEATRAGIIDNVVNRFCERKGKSIIPKQIGIDLISRLPVEDLKSPVLTAKFEQKLNLIAEGKYFFEDFLEEIEEKTEEWCNEIMSSEETTKIGEQSGAEDTGLKCPVCGGRVLKFSWGVCCEHRSKDDDGCKFAVGYTISGAKITDKDIKKLITDHRTGFIEGFKKKDGSSTFGACLELRDDGSVGFTWDLPYKCPVCGKQMQISSKSWGCSGWKEGCKFTIWNTTAGKKISDKDKIKLIEKGATDLIDGFISSKGKEFSAYLILKDGKVTFEFLPRK